MPADRSSNSKIPPAKSTLNASRLRIAVTSQAHTVSGMRHSVMPGARRSTVVAIKFSEPSGDAAEKIRMPASQSVWPMPSPGPVISPMPLSGGYAVQPLMGAPPGTAKAASTQKNAISVSQNDSILRRGNAISGAPI